MSAQDVLARLEKVRRTGPGKWIARCPAHDDKGPSLSIKEMPDGKTLLYCFAGCSAEEVADAGGFPMLALAPADGPGRDFRYAKAVRENFSAYDVLQVARFEILLACICAGDMAQGKALNDDDRARLLLAHQRLERAAYATERR